MRVTLTTIPDVSNGEIRQALVEELDGVPRRLAEWVVRTREADIREGLIRLGWTPPSTDRQEQDHA